MKMFRALLLALTVVLLSAGCAKKYTLLESGYRVPKEKTIAVSVFSPKIKGAGPSVLEGYLAAALTYRGYSVKVLNLEMLLGRSLLKRALPSGDYSARESIALGMELGGEIEGDRSLVNGILDSNEVEDAKRRAKGLRELAASVPVHWEVDYLMMVHQFDTYGFGVYVVELENQVIRYSLVVSGNRAGFQEALGSPTMGEKELAEDGDVSRLEMLRLASRVSMVISEGRR